MQCSLPYPTWISFPSNLKSHSARQLKNCSSHEGFTGLPVPNQTLKSSPLSWMIFWLTKPFLQVAREDLSGFTSWKCAQPFAAMPLCPRVWRGTRLRGTQAAAGGKGAGGATAVGVLGGECWLLFKSAADASARVWRSSRWLTEPEVYKWLFFWLLLILDLECLQTEQHLSLLLIQKDISPSSSGIFLRGKKNKKEEEKGI